MKSFLLSGLALLLVFHGALGFAPSKRPNGVGAWNPVPYRPQTEQRFGTRLWSSPGDSDIDGMKFVLHRHRGSRLAYVPSGMRLVTAAEARARRNYLVTFVLSEWDIARLAGGWKIDGKGYGGIIKREHGRGGIQKNANGGEILSCCIITPWVLSRDQEEVEKLEEIRTMTSVHEESLIAWQ